MKKQHLYLVVYLVVGFAALMHASSASAQSLGLNFAATDPDAPTSSLNPTDVAGVVPAANWNNLTGNIGTPAVGNLVYNNAGTPVASTATVTWNSNNTWRSGANNAFGGADLVLMSGYLDTTDTAAGAATVTVSNIDAALRGQSYDVYVYFVRDGGDNYGGGYTINDGTTTQVRFGSSMATPSAFVEDPGLDIDNSVDGNYLRFRRLAGTSFTLSANTTLTTPNGIRAPINAIQIVGGQLSPGDVNNDGVTNLADYTIIRNNLETSVAQYTNGDLNGDARVDLNDFRRWTTYAPPAIAASVGVPEPAAATLAAVATLLAAALRRQRRA